MNETTKALDRRRRLGQLQYLRGRGIDIGAGLDPLVTPYGTVDVFDKAQGNAQFMSEVPDNSYDFVYSSHCLEHLKEVEYTLYSWTRILRPGGTLLIIVPDYELYEHNCWPSQFNEEHLSSFSLTVSRYDVKRTNHYHIPSQIVPVLHTLGIENIVTTLEDDFYDYTDVTADQTLGVALAQISIIGHRHDSRIS